MAYASLDPHTILMNGLRDLGCSPRAFAGIAGVSQSRISRAFLGQAPLSDADCKRLLVVLAEMHSLADVSPARPAWELTDSIRGALAVRREVRQARESMAAGDRSLDIWTNVLSHLSAAELLRLVATHGLEEVAQRISDVDVRNEILDSLAAARREVHV